MNGRAVLFGLNCYLASMAALWVSFSFELPNPWWSVVTVILTSQPAAEGSIWAKATFRVAGTLAGLAVALIIIPNLVDAPEVMIGALALWVGACVLVAVQDRTAASYTVLLAGYGAVLVGLPVIDNPVNIFPTAVARTEEIVIGVVCAALAHGLLFPRSIHGMLGLRALAIRDEAQRSLAALLRGTPSASDNTLSQAAVDISLQAGALRFETPRGRDRSSVARALAATLATLVSHLGGVAERWADPALGPLPETVRAALAEAAGVVEKSDPFAWARVDEVLRLCTPRVGPGASREVLLQAGLVERARELVKLFRATDDLAIALANPDRAVSMETQALVARAPRLDFHRDPVVAAWSALNAALAIGVCGVLALAVQWPPATVGIGISAVLTSLFAAFDDPTPFMRKMLVWTLVSIPIGLVWVFAILPAADGFVPLAICLLPVIAIPATFMAVPRHSLRALAVLLVTTTVIGLQPSYRGDFETFANLALSSTLGTVAALVVTQTFRVISAATQAKRIHAAAHRDLVRMGGASPMPVFAFATRMLDRALLESARLPTHQSALLRELRIGVNVAELNDAALHLGPEDQAHLQQVRREMSSGRVLHTGGGRAEMVDALIPVLSRIEPEQARLSAITAWSGLSAALGHA